MKENYSAVNLFSLGTTPTSEEITVPRKMATWKKNTLITGIALSIAGTVGYLCSRPSTKKTK